MTRYFLSRISVEGFRGINNETDPLELRFSIDAVNSVHGTNGVGKSSLFEALCYAFRGAVPKLAELQSQEKPDAYVCNRFHSSGCAKIALDLQPDDGGDAIQILVERTRDGVRRVSSPSGYASPETLLRRLNQEFALLDYRSFTRFIDATPLDRGRSFSALLGLAAYSDMRQTLQSAAETRALNSDFKISEHRATARVEEDLAGSALRKLCTAYEGLLGKALTDVAKLEAHAAEVVLALAGIPLLTPVVASANLDLIDFAALKGAIGKAEGGTQRVELESILADIARVEALATRDHAMVAFEQESLLRLVREKAALLEETRGSAFKKLYESAETLFTTGAWPDLSTCPLCDRGELSQSIQDIVSSQLRNFRAVAEKSDAIIRACQTSGWLQRLDALRRLLDPVNAPSTENLAEDVRHQAKTGTLTSEAVQACVEGLTGLECRLTEKLAALKARKKELQATLPASLVQLSEQVAHAEAFREARSEYLLHKGKQELASRKLALRERWQRFICRAAEVFGAAESTLARGRIASIEAAYKSIFQQIMVVDDIVPELQRQAQKQDLNVLLRDFHGQSEVSARALLSESYRNALAISVFLSAALRHSGEPRFIVLDDVTSSFDAGHQWNLMEVIRTQLQHPNNPNGMQFIILSHDGLLEKYFDKLGNAPGWRSQKLQGWPPRGAVMTNLQDSNRLRATAVRLLEAGQVREAEPLVRQYLEFQLLEVITHVRVPVPLDFAISDHAKMVSNCLTAITGAVELHRKAGTLVLDVGQVNALGTVHMPALVANWVSHYETSSKTCFAPPVLKGILNSIDSFTDCFKYDVSTSGKAKPDRRWYKSLSARA